MSDPSAAALATMPGDLTAIAKPDSAEDSQGGSGSLSGGAAGVRGSRAVKAATDLLQCQVESCKADLSDLREYHQRYKICEYHLKVPSIVLNDLTQRFCQQCGRFHLIEAFDDHKRSCRERLQKHNARRRKKVQEANAAAEAEAAQNDNLEDVIRRGAGGESFSKRKKKELGMDGLFGVQLGDLSGGESSASGYDSQESLGAYFNTGLLLGRNSVNSSSPGVASDMAVQANLTQSQQMLLDSLTSNLQTMPGRVMGRHQAGRRASSGFIPGNGLGSGLDRSISLPKNFDLTSPTGMQALQAMGQGPGLGPDVQAQRFASGTNFGGNPLGLSPDMGPGGMLNMRKSMTRMNDNTPLSLDSVSRFAQEAAGSRPGSFNGQLLSAAAANSNGAASVGNTGGPLFAGEQQQLMQQHQQAMVFGGVQSRLQGWGGTSTSMGAGNNGLSGQQQQQWGVSGMGGSNNGSLQQQQWGGMGMGAGGGPQMLSQQEQQGGMGMPDPLEALLQDIEAPVNNSIFNNNSLVGRAQNAGNPQATTQLELVMQRRQQQEAMLRQQQQQRQQQQMQQLQQQQMQFQQYQQQQQHMLMMQQKQQQQQQQGMLPQHQQNLTMQQVLEQRQKQMEALLSRPDSDETGSSAATAFQTAQSFGDASLSIQQRMSANNYMNNVNAASGQLPGNTLLSNMGAGGQGDLLAMHQQQQQHVSPQSSGHQQHSQHSPQHSSQCPQAVSPPASGHQQHSPQHSGGHPMHNVVQMQGMMMQGQAAMLMQQQQMVEPPPAELLRMQMQNVPTGMPGQQQRQQEHLPLDIPSAELMQLQVKGDDGGTPMTHSEQLLEVMFDDPMMQPQQGEEPWLLGGEGGAVFTAPMGDTAEV